MKKIAIFLFSVVCGVISIALLIVGTFMGFSAENVKQGSFWTGFQVYFWCSLGCVLFTVVMTVIMVGICQIVDKLNEINSRLAQNEQYKLDSDTADENIELPRPAEKRKDIDYNNATCSNCC